MKIAGKLTLLLKRIIIRSLALVNRKNYIKANDLISTNTKEDLVVLKCMFCDSLKHLSADSEVVSGLSIQARKNILIKRKHAINV